MYKFCIIFLSLLLFSGGVAGLSLFTGWLIGLTPHPPEPYRIPVAILCLIAGLACLAGLCSLIIG